MPDHLIGDANVAAFGVTGFWLGHSVALSCAASRALSVN
jgi:hypothetical protein